MTIIITITITIMTITTVILLPKVSLSLDAAPDLPALARLRDEAAFDLAAALPKISLVYLSNVTH